MKTTDDCLVIGAGVVGLSLAYELAGHGLRVRVMERGTVGREASWAGAGILPAAVLRPGDAAYYQLSGLSHELHPRWARQLLAETGIDNGYRRCGEIYVARDDRQAEELAEEMAQLRGRGIAVTDLSWDQLAECEPAVRRAGGPPPVVLCSQVPQSGQLRNPRHLKALRAACALRNVQFVTNAEVVDFDVQGGHVRELISTSGRYQAENYCVTAGAWSGAVLQKLHCAPPIKPIRGQIVLLKVDRPPLRSVIHEGLFYLVPRDDGRVLVGSTLEDVGFDQRTTAVAVRQLLAFAASIVPQLADAEVERCWAGLRPGSPEGLPYIGRVPGLDNALVASGHFRWGLFLSAATAVVLGEVLRGVSPHIDLTEFRLDRT